MDCQIVNLTLLFCMVFSACDVLNLLQSQTMLRTSYHHARPLPFIGFRFDHGTVNPPK